MKISKIRIQNFKVLSDREIDFLSSDLVIFDGPNGFGKTSIYDAIELLFTGIIRRYTVLQSLIVDGRETYYEHPFYTENATGDIIICCEFEKNDTIYVLERIGKKEELINGVNFSTYKLYQKENFETTDRELIQNESQFLTTILGANYKENFQFLNYIEQEDSLFLLKSQDKNRKQHISHLFNVTEFENKISQINLIKQKIDSFCSSEEKLILENIKQEIKLAEDFVAKNFTDTAYIKLFPEKSINWDDANFNFENTNYSDLLGEDGKLTRLSNFLNHREAFKKYIDNETIDNLTRNETILQNFCKFYRFIPNRDGLNIEKDIFIKKQKYVERLTDFSIQELQDDDFEFNFENFKYIDDALSAEFENAINELKIELKDLDKLEDINSKINDSRQKLVDKIEELQEEDVLVLGNCVLCGYNWGDINILLESIHNQTNVLKGVSTEKNKHFEEKFKQFKNGIATVIKNLINQDILDNSLDKEFISKLVSLETTYFVNTVKSLEKINFDYSAYLNENLSNDIETKCEQLIRDLQEKKHMIQMDEVEQYYKEYFDEYFDGNFEYLNSIKAEDAKKKTEFLKYKYSLLRNEFLVDKKIELLLKQTKFDNAKKLGEQIKQLKNIYGNSLRKYQTKVIKDIEILFHIYSGRIMQDFQGGLGLFIYSDKNGIRFQTNPTKTFDAVFSMSSGQLSALIIAFTLALHKKYSQNKIILIDDPVQTLDELNVVGFVELLRNEFAKNQIIISTHEDMMSSFIRYKFKNYNLSQTRVNLKSNA